MHEVKPIFFQRTQENKYNFSTGSDFTLMLFVIFEQCTTEIDRTRLTTTPVGYIVDLWLPNM